MRNANEERRLEVYRFLCDELGAESAQFTPIFERASNGDAQRGLTACITRETLAW